MESVCANTVHVGIIGTGRISERHVAALQAAPGASVIAACSTSGARAGEFAARHGIARALTDFHELLALPELDAVVITTWNRSHAEIACASLNAGKHVLVEKPMALNADEATAMAAAAAASGKLLMVGMVRRFSERTRALKRLIDAGQLGTLYYARAGYVRRWGNPGGWFARRETSGGGPVIDLGVHVIDLVRYLAGGPRPVSVSASVFSRLGMQPDVRGADKYRSVDYSDANDVEDGAVALIRFEGGLTLAVEVSWVQHTKAEKTYIEVYGDRAGAQLDPELEVYSTVDGYLTDSRPQIDPAFSTTARSFATQAAHFIDCIARDVTCLSPAADGVTLMRIIDAIYESARLGREVRLD